MKVALLFLLSAGMLVGCTTPETRQRLEIAQHRRYLQEQVHLITVCPSDGISEVEAYKIGRDRFDTYGIGCGIVTVPVDLGDYWRVTTCIGVVGGPFEDILIRKSDGSTAITEAKLPRVPNPQGGANGWEPLHSDTNEASTVTATRRSPRRYAQYL